MKYILVLIVCFIACNSPIENHIPVDRELIIKSSGGHLHGSFLSPVDSTQHNQVIAIIIAGSGPTDRNCNSGQMKCDAYKLLADSLVKNNIASFRYDKRGVGKSNDFKMNEADLRFDDFVNDAIACIKYFDSIKRFSKIIMIGHSEGALIGMLASKKTNVAAFVSLCGAGRSIDKVLKEQLATQPEAIKMECNKIIDSLKKGVAAVNVSPMLSSLFRLSVQPYLISWMKFDPAKEFSDFKVPSLIIGGDSDLQVSVADADSLKKANPLSKYKIIAGMNHPLRTGFKTKAENMDSYNQPKLPIAPDLVKTIVDFVFELK